MDVAHQLNLTRERRIRYACDKSYLLT
jgi:hypothetical protein